MQHPDAASAVVSGRLYSVARAAELLGCSRFHVYRLIEAGEFPVYDIAVPGARQSKTRIKAEDLDAYLTRVTLR